MDENDSIPDAGFDSEVEALLHACKGEAEFEDILKLDRIGPYHLERFLGAGGMGLVYEARQSSPIQRTVAIKLIKAGMDTRAVVARFDAERQALAMMDHPGIARVFDAGEAEDGRPYFVMENVDGIPITTYCDRNRLRVEDRLRLFQAVCRGVQHAHQKGILHRDLKPSNVLVLTVDGRPVPKIIDFGIARAIERTGSDWTRCTESGHILGTPEYMSPEQADPGLGDVDIRTDIYSLGVILYEMLVGALPLDLEEARKGLADDLRRMIRDQDPPRPGTRLMQLGDRGRKVAHQRSTDVRTLARQLRGELDWIVMKALEKELDRRYATVSGFEADVERYLNVEPIDARPPSTRYRVRKFVQKHRVGFTIAATLLLILIAGVIVSSVLYLEAKARAGQVVRLADLHRLNALLREADYVFWPPHPRWIPEMKRWVAEVEAIKARLPVHEQTLAKLRERMTGRRPRDCKELREFDTRIRYLEQCLRSKKNELAEVERAGGPHPGFKTREQILEDIQEMEKGLHYQKQARRAFLRPVFGDMTDQWQHDILHRLVKAVKALGAPDSARSMLACVKERIEAAGRITEASVTGPEVSADWNRAIKDIAQSKVYGGLHLTPQLGLVPLERNPWTGLWEFWHVQSGKRPCRNHDSNAPSRWIMEKDTGLVLVLIPGGRFRMGAVRAGDPDRTNVDVNALDGEGPVHEVTVDAFFLSKYETTQGQWTAMLRSWSGMSVTLRCNRSYFKESLWEAGHWTLKHPVEQVEHDEAGMILNRWGLRLPTEVEWEYAARAGTRTPWWTGRTASTLKGAANIADLTFHQRRPDEFEDWSDDYWGTAPVGRFRPNPWGLHDMMGNVSEWCLDGLLPYDERPRDGDGLRLGLGALEMVRRGGSWKELAKAARSACRGSGSQNGADIGFRAALSIRKSG